MPECNLKKLQVYRIFKKLNRHRSLLIVLFLKKIINRNFDCCSFFYNIISLNHGRRTWRPYILIWNVFNIASNQFCLDSQRLHFSKILSNHLSRFLENLYFKAIVLNFNLTNKRRKHVGTFLKHISKNQIMVCYLSPIYILGSIEIIKI